MKTQSQLQETDPITAKHQWHDAMEEHKIASLRVARAEEDVDEWQREIRNATTNTAITEEARMAGLCQELSAAMQRLEDAEAEKKAKQRRLREAWTLWEPFASAKAQPVPRINRVGTLQREARRVTEGVPAASRAQKPAEVPTAPPATLRAVRERRERDAAEHHSESVPVPKRIRGTPIRDRATKPE